MIDPDVVRAELRRLARGGAVPARDRERVIERAAEASRDVEAAAAFVASGGRERLAGAVAADEREGKDARATRGRAILARYEQFVAACEPRAGEGPPGDPGPDEQCRRGREDGRSRPLPPRSRNE